MTEDGMSVVLAHEEAGKLSIWDVRAEKVVRTISSASPSYVLCRGGRVFVANRKKGAINVFDPPKEWRLSDEILLKDNDLCYLSAPGGEHFKGVILASCGRDKGRFFSVDTQKDEVREIPQGYGDQGGITSFSYDGKQIVRQSRFDYSPSGKTAFAATADYMAGKKDVFKAGENASVPFLFQVREGALWFGAGGAYVGMPPTAMRKDMGILLFADVTRPAFYALKGTSLTSHAVDTAAQPFATTNVSFPPEWKRGQSDGLYRLEPKWRSPEIGYTFHHPLAVSHEGVTHLFALEREKHSVLYCRVRLVDAQSAAAAAANGGKPLQETGKLQPLPLDDAVTSYAMTENGELLLIAHEGKDQVSIWDVRARRVVKRVGCASPRYIICRGGIAYAANYGKGTVSVLEQARGWAVSGQIPIGDPSVYYLSAPAGKNFNGTLLAVCGSPRDPRYASTFAVDTKGQTAKRLFGDQDLCTAGYSYDGKAIITQMFGQSPAGVPKLFDATAYLSGKASHIRPPEGTFADTPLLLQAADGDFWFGINQLYAGLPPKPAGPITIGVIFPDLTAPAYYVFSKNTVTRHNLDAAREQVASYQIEISADWPVQNYRQQPFKTHYAQHTYFHPVAATHGLTTHLFTRDFKSPLLFHCALGVQDGTATDSPAGTDVFPVRILAGQPVTYRLQKVEGPFEVVTAPAGVNISTDGTLTWTPTSNQIGQQQIKIRIGVGNEVKFLRLSTEVTR